MTTLISADDHWTLWAVMVVGTAFAIWLEQTYRWAARVSAPVVALLLAMALSNTGIVPTEAPSYDWVGTYLVPLAVPLLLLRANVLQIARDTGRLLLVFHVAALGSIAGAVAAFAALHGRVPEAAKAAGIMGASYIGGSVNFMAVSESSRAAKDTTGPLIVADNVVMAGFFLLLLGIAGSRFFQRFFPHPHSEKTDADAAGQAAAHWGRQGIGLLDIARSLAVASAVVAAALLLKRWTESLFPGVPSGALGLLARELVTNKYVLITSVTLLVATVAHRSLARINGATELGGFLLYLFLFSIGLPADLRAVLLKSPLFFVFCGIIALCNVTVTLVIGYVCRMNLEELMLSCNATLGGPPTAAAMCVSKGWSRLVLPGILVGLWGYVIGTPVGILLISALELWKKA